MNIVDDEALKRERSELLAKFTTYSSHLQPTYQACESMACTWEYSLGRTRDMVPHEYIVPTDFNIKGRRLNRVTKTSSQSKHLVPYGYDAKGSLIISKSRPHKDTERYGESVRMVSGEFLLCAHMYTSTPTSSRLGSLIRKYEKTGKIYYVSITPPADWFVRIDEMADGRIVRSSMLATRWYRQLDYDYVYGESGALIRILIGDHIHWQKPSE